jgi:hypothetical protein
MTSVKKEVTHEDEATILSKIVDQLDSNGCVRSVIRPIGNRSLSGLMMCSGASDDTSIFTRTRGH